MLVVRLAVPPLSVAVPRVAEPSRKVTVPVAVDGVTAAVKVTVCPTVDEAGDTVRVVVVVVSPGVMVTVFDVLGAKLPSPLYVAVRVWLPVARVVAVKVAVPLVSVPVPRVVVPSLNVTVPVAPEGVTVAVSKVEETVSVVVVGAKLMVSVTKLDFPDRVLGPL